MIASVAVSDPYEGLGVDRDAALRMLYDSDYRSLLRLASLLVDDRNLAEDVVQEAFARLYHSWDRVRDPAAAPAWLRSAVLNLARSTLRRRRAFTRIRFVPAPHASSPEGAAVLSEDRQEVLAALAALSRRQREVLVLRYWADLSEAEIAAALGVSAGSVKTHAHRGLLALREALEDRR
jgi:RNA polymerase sigma-70 factor (sigma-E family)